MATLVLLTGVLTPAWPLAAQQGPSHSTASSFCPPLPAATGPTVTVGTEADLRSQAYGAPAGTAILVSPGTYAMADFVHIVNAGITLRGSTGDPDDVILDFGGMVGGHFGIMVSADDVTIADLTARNAADHGVSIQGVDRPTLYNLHILDINDQLVKVNPLGDGSDDGLLACSRLAYTTTDPDGYTNGISGHNAHRWTIRDNAWVRIRTSNGTPVPAILFWSGSSDTLVERNTLIDCSQGIAFGNASQVGVNHTGGVVRNNLIYASQPHDVMIEMVRSTGWQVGHNTVIGLNPAPGLSWLIEARYSESAGTFANNLSNLAVWVDRDGAAGTSTGDVVTAEASWFVDGSPANAADVDLHLDPSATGAIDVAERVSWASLDIDGELRPGGRLADAGADEAGPLTLNTLVFLPLVLR